MRIDGVSSQNITNYIPVSSSGTNVNNQSSEVKQPEQVVQVAPNEITASESDIDEEQVIQAIESANKHLVLHNTQLEFSIHEKTKQIMVKVLDSETKEVIREIPPEKILDMVAKLWEMAGIFVDERR